MKNKKAFGFLSLVFLLFAICFSLFASSAKADEYDDLQKKIDDLTRSLEMSKAATTPLEATLTNLEKQIAAIREQIANLEADLVRKEKQVADGEKLLTYQQQILERKVRTLYKNTYKKNSLNLQAVLTSNFSDVVRILGYQKSVVADDKNTISEVVLYIKDLEDKKKEIESEKVKLAKAKEDTDRQAEFFRKEIAGAKKYQIELGKQIVQLTARQQQILAERLASLNIPKSAYTTQGGCSSDLTNGKPIPFSPALGFFTYGVPHRVGLNQYGSKGRAEIGQNARQILEAYYSAEYKEGYDTSINIHVVGTNEYGQTFDNNWNIEEYLKHVYEVPTNWPMEALKAQAIAARSYALAATGNGSGTICPSQSCQVVKQEENSDAWKQAVDQTKGIVLLNGGNPIAAYFSSTAGGYTHDSSNDISSRPWTKNTQDGRNSYNNLDDVKNNAYDKDSPWFYCDWGSRTDYNKTAWLKSDEVADIVNTLMLVKRDSSTAENLYQTDKPNPAPAGKETWSPDRVKSELKSRGGSPYNNVSDISVSVDFGYGKTTTVNVNGDAGSNSFDANDFKNRFNLRAPANIQIVGPLYNVEKR